MNSTPQSDAATTIDPSKVDYATAEISSPSTDPESFPPPRSIPATRLADGSDLATGTGGGQPIEAQHDGPVAADEAPVHPKSDLQTIAAQPLAMLAETDHPES